MNVLWTDIVGWWLRLAVAGGLLLLAGLALVLACRRPAIRLSTGSWVFAVTLLLVILTFLPGWFKLPWSLPAANEAVAVSVAEPRVADLVKTPATTKYVVPTLVEEDSLDPVLQQEETAPELAGAKATDPIASAAQILPPPASAENRSNRGWIANVLLLCYFSIALALVCRLAVGQWRLESLWRSGSQPPDTLRRAFRKSARQFRCRPALRISDRVAGPICFGVLRPRIVVPSILANCADERTLRWIIAHELSHLKRRDPLVGWLMGIAQTIFFFVPWFWKLRREVRLNQEFLADAAAASPSASIGSAADYADFLLRLTCAGKLPIGAAGVKSPSSDLYRRVTMLLQKTGTVNANCPRRWSLLAGGGLLALGIVLGGLQFSTRNVAAEPDKKTEPAKKDAVNDEDEIRKALEDLKKGPEPKKVDKPADLNPIDEAKKAEEALKKAQDELRKNPKSDDARKAFEAAVKKYQETMRNRQAAPFPNFPQFQPGDFPQFPPLQLPRIEPGVFPPFPQLQPLDPGDFEKQAEMMQKMMDDLQRQLQLQLQGQPGVFPGRIGGFRNVNRRAGDSRLGLRIEKPTPILAEQLDLPANKGMVVTEVVPDSAGAKAGIRINDIIMEIGGKAVSSDLLDLQRMMGDFKADQKVDVVVIRKGKKETLKDVSLPEAKPEQLNPFNPRLPLNPRLQIPNPRLPNGFPPEFLNNDNGANTSMSVQILNGEYHIKYQEDGVKLDITGAKQDDQFKPSSIEIDDNGKTVKAASLDKVAEAYRPMVEKVLKRIR